MLYIIRFSDNNIIQTLQTTDKNTCDYIITELEKNNKEYVIIKHNQIKNKRYIQTLLDYEV